MVEMIKELWAENINGQLKNYQVVCKYNPKMILDDKTVTQCYTIVIYGANQLISNCCSQLVCFQFLEYFKRLEV